MQSLARERRPLSLEELCSWHALITEEQTHHGHPRPAASMGHLRGPSDPVEVRVGGHVPPAYDQVEPLLRQWLEDVNQHARTAFSEESCIVQAIADTLQRFEVIRPFADGNGRIGRLVANWVALQAPVPLILFREAERQAFYAAHRSERAMRAFIAEKLREACFYVPWERIPAPKGEITDETFRAWYFDYGEIALRQSSMGATDVCETASGDVVLVEHHEVLDALERWQAEERE
ncbi:Fic family protein [Polyangium fumosum]|nr:Fic family protein [Polyangium fumosum]